MSLREVIIRIVFYLKIPLILTIDSFQLTSDNFSGQSFRPLSTLLLANVTVTSTQKNEINKGIDYVYFRFSNTFYCSHLFS